MTAIYMVNPSKKRYYYIMLYKDIFDVWCIQKSYGGLSNNHAHSIVIACDSFAMANDLLAQTEQIRLKHGYIYANIDHVEHYHLTPQIRED